MRKTYLISVESRRSGPKQHARLFTPLETARSCTLREHDHRWDEPLQLSYYINTHSAQPPTTASTLTSSTTSYR
eukprot:4023269-Amphidinium_carterae.2